MIGVDGCSCDSKEEERALILVSGFIESIVRICLMIGHDGAPESKAKIC